MDELFNEYAAQEATFFYYAIWAAKKAEMRRKTPQYFILG